MPDLFSLLGSLACPIGMGLMMWFLLRASNAQTPSELPAASVNSLPETTPKRQEGTNAFSPSPLKAIWDCVQMCLNWKVLVSLAVVVLLIGVVAPQLFWAALPALVALVCPLSMVVMMAQMGKRRGRPTVAHPMEPECPACLYEAPSVQEAHEAAAEQEALPRVPLKR